MTLGTKMHDMIRLVKLAFYPKVTIVICFIAACALDLTISVILRSVERGSILYDTLLALFTGVTASFIVAIIVELGNNYRFNRLALHELQDYNNALCCYEIGEVLRMNNNSFQCNERNNILKGLDAEEKQQDDFEDIIRVTWEQLPIIIPALKDTFDNKKQFLTEKEIYELCYIFENYMVIWDEIKRLILMSPFLHNTLNDCDEQVLFCLQNSLDDFPEGILEKIANKKRMEIVEQLTETIMLDSCLLTEFMSDYDISESSVNYYENIDDEEDASYEPEDEDLITMNVEQKQLLIKEQIPFVEGRISNLCKEISDSMIVLKRELRRRPYFGLTYLCVDMES